MRWSLSDEQTMFQETFRAWIASTGAGGERRRWFDERDHATFERHLVTGGWLGAGTPLSLGGDGGGLPELALAAEEMGAATVPSGAWLATVLALPALTSQPAAAALALRQGEFACLAVPAGAPADQGGPGVRFDPADAAVSGSVGLVLAADRAARLVVPALTAGGVALFLVDAGDRGVTVRPRRLLDRSRSMADVAFERAPAQRLDADAAAFLGEAARRGAVLVAADALGAAERMMEMAVAYTKVREQFGVPVGSFQAVKHAAASMLVTVESVRSVVHYAACTVEQGDPDADLHAAVAKAQATAGAVRVADDGLLLHGAIGYTFEYDFQLSYKRAKLDEDLFGAPPVWNERLAAGLDLAPGAAVADRPAMA